MVTVPPPPERGSAGLASQVLLELGLKPVVRELHAPEDVPAARERWAAMALETAVGEPVREDAATRAMVSDTDAAHTIRPLARHPVVERAIELGGPLARRVLLDADSPVYQWLCARHGADQAPLVDARPDEAAARHRQTVYIARRLADAERARDLDRMGADDATEADSRALGALLGYPACCVDAFCALPRRWPNRIPIEAARQRTRRFEPRLNNLSLERFAWVAHFPCRYDCAASLALADAAAEALAERRPELVARVDALLALPRLFRSDDRQAVLLGATWTGAGRIAFEGLVPLAAAWPGPGGAAPAGWGDLEAADAVRLTRDGAVFTAAGREVRVADRPLVLPFGLGEGPG